VATTKTLYMTSKRRVALAMLAGLLGLMLGAGNAAAQTRYAYLPTANTKDAHFLSIAGAGFQTLGGDITLKLGSPSTASSIEIGIFDGETSGLWDYGNIPLFFTLYADPNGDGTGTQQLAQWNGATMPDNAWFSATVTNTSAARGASGDYFYMLKVTTPNAAASYLSVFKARTNGTISIIATQPFAYIAPINSLGDAQVIYPNYPILSPTTYDGSWNFFMDIQKPLTNLEMWDGDMDYGKFDCSENDNDDPDTPNEVPSWAVGTAAVAEGLAGGGVPCVDLNGTVTIGTTTSNPPDDSYRPTSQRGPSVTYDLIDPNGVHYANTNPSGNVEWERFNVSTDPMNRAQMDYHAASLPAGIYQVKISGVDMSNLNAFRFPFDVIGVDSLGDPVSLIRPFTVHGKVFYDANSNGVQDGTSEPGLEDVDLIISNGDTATTDSNGNYSFEDLEPGTYTVRVDPSSLGDGLSAVSDYDGINTVNSASVVIGQGQPDRNVFFGYKREVTTPGGGGQCSDIHSWQWWATHSSEWPVSSITIGNTRYTKSQAICLLRKTRTCDIRSLMYAEVIAAKLNDANGGSNCIRETIMDAENWLTRATSGCYRNDDNNNNYCNNNYRNNDDRRNCGRRSCRDYGHNNCHDRNYQKNNCSASRTNGTKLNRDLHAYNSCQGCPADFH
jgi:hypothetical protein